LYACTHAHVCLCIIYNYQVWRDLKSNASKKASKLRNERNRTGNFPVHTDSLDTLQKRIISCIGLEYVEGSRECADSMPEEEIHIFISLIGELPIYNTGYF